MRHDLSLDGHAFRLRPIERGDSGFVLALRSDPPAAPWLHRVSGLEEQAEWLDRYFLRPGDWYWIVERRVDGTPEGTIGLYNLDRATGRALLGRWVLTPRSLAAAESALLVYTLAFDRLGLDEVYTLVITTNVSVVSFHDRAGLERVGLVHDAFHLGDTTVDAIEHRLRKERWPATREILEKHAVQAARLVERGSSG